MSATYTTDELREIATDNHATDAERQTARDLLESRGESLRVPVEAR